MKGHYKGYYEYDKHGIQKNVPHGVTFFFVDITETDGKKFTGTIQDDIFTGGTPGIGTISGELKGDKITFIKQMPVATFLVDGQMKNFDKNHPEIYYTGIRTERKFAGTWKIKFGFFRVGLLLLLGARTTGTWEMEKSSGE
jgi:hypothetical protein